MGKGRMAGNPLQGRVLAQANPLVTLVTLMTLMTSKNRLRAACVASIVAVAVVVPGASGSLRAEIIEQILVKVNGEIFTKTDLESRQVAILRQKGQQIDLKSDPGTKQVRSL